MGYGSNAFGGQAQTWALHLGTWGFNRLVEARSLAPFVTSCAHEPCVIMPRVEPQSIRLSLYYGAKRSLSIQRVSDTSPFSLAAEWRKFCRAFVICEVDSSYSPALAVWDHNSTRNAKSELLLLGHPQMPTLAELDGTIGTSLELFEAKPLESARRAIDEAPSMMPRKSLASLPLSFYAL